MKTKHNYSNSIDWVAALIRVAEKHRCERLIRDFEAWTANWINETPDEAFYAEYPAYAEDK